MVADDLDGSNAWTHPVLATLLAPLLAYHPQRTTTSVKMTNLISFALAHLSDPSKADTPFVLHSLPPDPQKMYDPDGPSARTPSVIPRLVSMAEIIRRSYVPLGGGAVPVDKGKGKGKASGVLEGLHQYIRVGALEELGIPKPGNSRENAEQRSDRIATEWLENGGGGVKAPRRSHTPYMVVVLSTVPVPSLAALASYTYQPPTPTTAIPLAATAAPAPPVDDTAADALPPVELTTAFDPPKRKRKRSNKRAGTAKEMQVDGPILPPDLLM